MLMISAIVPKGGQNDSAEPVNVAIGVRMIRRCKKVLCAENSAYTLEELRSKFKSVV